MPVVIDRGRSVGLRHALVGSTASVVNGLRGELERQLPGVQILTAIAPEPGAEDDDAVLEGIRRGSPHVIWLALGAPKQELWMHRHASSLSPALVVGVGAAFDFHAGAKRRAPVWMRRLGLEWVFRFAAEPRRLGGRYLRTNTAFVLSAARQLARRGKPT
jgi:N-acetylglucosaminyldiphosphoundecaprenol N-acetyl-beta-D-mannosaminyltransferase